MLDDAVRDARLSHSRAQPAVQETQIQIGEGASLEYLPDHVIPYRDSRFRQSLRVEMGRGSRAIFWDALAAGRVAHGERWNFHEVDSRIGDFPVRTKPSFSTAPEFVRPLSIPSDWVSPKDSTTWQRLSLWRMNSNSWKETVAAMDAELRNMPHVYGGASALASGGCVVKLLARSASDLTRAQAALWGRARQIVFGSPAIDLRKY